MDWIKVNRGIVTTIRTTNWFSDVFVCVYYTILLLRLSANHLHLHHLQHIIYLLLFDSIFPPVVVVVALVIGKIYL